MNNGIQKICQLIILFFIFSLLYNLKVTAISSETPIYSNPSIESDFDLNSICILLKTDYNNSNKEYNKFNFLELNCDYVEEPDYDFQKMVYSLYNGNKPIYNGVIFEDLYSLDLNNYHRYLYIKWNQTQTKEEIINSINLLYERDDIYYACPNYTFEFCSVTPNDSNYQNNLAQLINLPNAWSISTGSPKTYVGIMDTGIDGTHQDLLSNLNNNLHNDFTTNNNGQPLVDICDHGTRVAGIVGAKGNNSIGTAGVNWNTNLVSLKISNNETASLSNAVNAINYARLHNIKILNFSAKTTEQNLVLYNALVNYTGLFVCAAGNENKSIDIDPVYPAAYSSVLSNVISVGAIQSPDEKTQLSNFGSNNVSIYTFDNYYTTFTNNSYSSTTGTSFSTPVVTGTAALMLSIDNSLTPSQLKSLILTNSDIIQLHLTISQYEVQQFGTAKRLNILNILKNVLQNKQQSTIGLYPITESQSFNSTLSLNNQYYDNSQYYKLYVADAAYYEFRFIYSSNIDVKIFDYNINEIPYNNISNLNEIKYVKYLQSGYYFIKIEMRSTSNSCTVNTIINHKQNTLINYNQLNTYSASNINTQELVYYNNNSSGFYYIEFYGLSPSNYVIELPDEALEIYSDEEKNYNVNKLNSNSQFLSAASLYSINTICVFLEENTYYYFDIESNISDLYNYCINIYPVNIESITDIDILSDHFNIQLMNNSCTSDLIIELDVDDDVEFTLNIVYQTTNSDDITFYFLKNNNIMQINNIIYNNTLNNSQNIQLLLNLEAGIYYLGILNNYSAGTINVSAIK